MDEEPEGRMAENDGAAQDAGAETLIDLLTGAAIRSTPKNRLVQKVLRQLIETYGFDRSTIRTGNSTAHAGLMAVVPSDDIGDVRVSRASNRKPSTLPPSAAKLAWMSHAAAIRSNLSVHSR